MPQATTAALPVVPKEEPGSGKINQAHLNPAGCVASLDMGRM